MRMSKKSYTRIKEKMRQLSMWSPELKAIKNKGRFQRVVGTYKNGKPKLRWFNTCQACEGAFELESIELDHKTEITTAVSVISKTEVDVDWGLFMELLWPSETSLQRLCGHCHGLKTQTYIQGRVKALKGPGGLL